LLIQNYQNVIQRSYYQRTDFYVKDNRILDKHTHYWKDLTEV